MTGEDLETGSWRSSRSGRNAQNYSIRDEDVILDFYAKMVPEALMNSLQRSVTGSTERCY